MNYWCEILKCLHLQCLNISLFSLYSEVDLNFQDMVPEKQNGTVYLIKPSEKKICQPKTASILRIRPSSYQVNEERGVKISVFS